MYVRVYVYIYIFIFIYLFIFIQTYVYIYIYMGVVENEIYNTPNGSFYRKKMINQRI